MKFEESYGWLKTISKSKYLKVSPDKILADYFEPSRQEIQSNWIPIANCIDRFGELIFSFELQKQKHDLIVRPNSREMGQVRRVGAVKQKEEKIVDLREKSCPLFIRYFEFETVALSGHVSFWQVGILKKRLLEETTELSNLSSTDFP